MNFSSEKPLNKYIKCSLNNCGCRTNPFIWINEKHKIIFLEIAKCGSSSIKKVLDIYPLERDLINSYYWHKENNSNPKKIFAFRFFKNLLLTNLSRNLKLKNSNYDFLKI